MFVCVCVPFCGFVLLVCCSDCLLVLSLFCCACMSVCLLVRFVGGVFVWLLVCRDVRVFVYFSVRVWVGGLVCLLACLFVSLFVGL